MGKTLFERKRYIQARHCYERAKMPLEKGIANAYFLREEARKRPTDTPQRSKAREQAFSLAANAFLSCAEGAEKAKIQYFRTAGDCFEASREGSRAAEAYHLAGDFTRAVQLYRKLGKFDEAIHVINLHRSQVTPTVVQEVTAVARLFYVSRRKFKWAYPYVSSIVC